MVSFQSGDLHTDGCDLSRTVDGVIRELTPVPQPDCWIKLIEIDNHMPNAGPATGKVQALLGEVSTR